MIYASYSKSSKKLKNGIAILVDLAVLSNGSKQSKYYFDQKLKNH